MADETIETNGNVTRPYLHTCELVDVYETTVNAVLVHTHTIPGQLLY